MDGSKNYVLIYQTQNFLMDVTFDFWGRGLWTTPNLNQYLFTERV